MIAFPFRAKHTAVEAVFLTRENFHEVGEWAGVKECWGLDAPSPMLFMETQRGLMSARPGIDFVIRTADGEFYPCKLDAFASTYEAMEPAISASKEIQ